MRVLAALAALLLCGAAWAGFPACVKRGAGAGYDEPASLASLLDCQDRARGTYRAGGGKLWDRFDDFQREEVRQYLARHPDRADADAGRPKPKSPAGKPVERKASAEAAAQDEEEAARQKERALMAGSANAGVLAPEERGGQAELGKKLWELSDGGKKGMTPAMAQEIVKRLQEQQGGVSVEMMALLGALQKDGAKLTDGSMLKLKDAARDAKAEGLDLGVGADLERWLLDPETDPEPDSPGLPVN
ncbi:MAG: hypothetical protein HY924_01420 [Elusimicrobia bacterium]|nr:hypothetical protein [Elusimicrobiota bacterium]